MLLSIGMIVKNEEKYLRDCLNGLQPIFDELGDESELIICDTGSTDSTVEIAKEFTDKVLQIKWQDDFAYARNKTLERSRGKWYLVIDADEIFQDVKDIVDFVKSAENKNYLSASVSIVNVLKDLDESNWSVFQSIRLYKKTKDLRWTGKIHECLTSSELAANPTANLKHLDSKILHYGYYFETTAERDAKLERNRKPLLEIFEADPKNARTIYQLAQEYMLTGEYDEVMKYLHMGRNLFEKGTNLLFYHAFQHQIVKNSYAMGKHDDVIETSRDYFNTSIYVAANAQHVKHWEGLSLYALGRYDEAAEAFLSSFNYLEKFETDQTGREIWAILAEMPVTKKMALQNLASSNTLAGNFDDAKKWIEKLDDDNPVKKEDPFTVYANSFASKEPKKLCKIYDYATAYKPGTPEYDNAITVLEKHLANHKIKKEVAEKLSEYKDLGDGYIYLHQLRHNCTKEIYYPVAHALLDNFLSLDMSFHQRFGDVVYAAIKLGVNFESFLEKMHISDTSKFVTMLAITNDDIDDYLLEYLKKHPISNIKTMRIFSDVLLVLAKNAPGNEAEEHEVKKHLALFESHIRMRNSYFRLIYSSNIYKDEAVESLSERDVFIFYAARAFDSKDSGDIAGFAKNLRNALHIYPESKETITIIFEQLKKEYGS